MLFYYAQGLKNVELTPFPSLLLDMNRLKTIKMANSSRLRKTKAIDRKDVLGVQNLDRSKNYLNFLHQQPITDRFS